ncbi:cytochrome c oxidase copper chaperone-like [Drosophila subobscura]|uniref:cytochrome c oxidase copper chaperone-like n=1 Tax=Drosophila subobscura TaxID=7241 RepID=UPI00155A3F7E|nr:cytochrome c oxidase copper chaperone-like [Drosophila subobscura]
MGSSLSNQFQAPPAAASEPIAAGIVAAEPITEETVATACDTNPKCSPCCACPESKQARDQCIVEHGEEHCMGVIDAYKKCMQEAGLNI